MAKNRELCLPFALSIVLAMVSALICGFSGGLIPALTGGGSVLLTTLIWVLVTRSRYKKLQGLGEYLASVYAGGELLDIRDNREGELSLLKNDLHKITMTLRQQSAQLSHDKEFLQQLLGSISHQLRTPLTGMLVMADLLARPDLPSEKRQEFTCQLTAQLERMQWLLEQLLTLSRLDAGCLELERKTVFISSLLDRATAPIKVALELRHQTLEVNCPQNLLWEGDEKWTAEAVTNLIKNASEHSPVGGLVKITVHGDALNLMIAVEDNGPGISESDIPYLFRRFYRGKNAAPGSAGIGLALAAELVRAQGGSATAENRHPGPGARFILKLPMYPCSL